MSGKRILTAILVLALPGLLGACGPGNTLVSRHTPSDGEDAQLKTVEASLQQIREQIKALEHKQAQSESRIAELQKKLGLPVGHTEAPAPAVPQGSALGAGFSRPAAEAAAPAASGLTPPAKEPAPGPATVPPAWNPMLPAAAQPGPEPTAMAASPSPFAAGQPPATPPPGGKGAHVGSAPIVEPRSMAEAKKHHAPGRVGPTGPAAPATPATPEAAIAADRSERQAAATPPAATEPQAEAAPKPPVAQPTQPTQPAQSAPPVAKAPSSPLPGNAETASPAEKNAYNQALQLAINGHQPEAKAAFDQFLTDHPKSPLVPNALYWVGEGAYQSGDYQGAMADFEKVAKGWPGHHKAADSLYKMAMAQEKSGNIPAARTTLERFLKEYPNAELAGAARQKLQALPQ